MGALWNMMKFYQRRLVSEEEYRQVVKWRTLAKVRQPRVIGHSFNLRSVDVTTLPADGTMVRIGLRQRVAAVYGYTPGRLELAVRNGPPDGPGFVAELDGEEDKGVDVVEPTSNYAITSDESREAWLDWFNEAE